MTRLGKEILFILAVFFIACRIMVWMGDRDLREIKTEIRLDK